MSSISRLLQEREQAFEALFKLEQEQAFKQRARRDYLFGLEIATKLGFFGPAARNYALNLARMDTQFAHDNMLIRRVLLDLASKGEATSTGALMDILENSQHQAFLDMMDSYPHALEKDHH